MIQKSYVLRGTKRGFVTSMRKGFTMIELAIASVILGILVAAVYMAMGSEVPKSVVQTMQKESETIISKVKEIGQTRTQKYTGLDAAGLDAYGIALPYTVDVGNNRIISQAAGGCFYTVTPAGTGYVFDFSVNCDNAAAWSAGAATGTNKKIKDYVVQALTDRLTTAYGSGLTVTNDKSSGKLSVSFAGIQ